MPVIGADRPKAEPLAKKNVKLVKGEDISPPSTPKQEEEKVKKSSNKEFKDEYAQQAYTIRYVPTTHLIIYIYRVEDLTEIIISNLHSPISPYFAISRPRSRNRRVDIPCE